MHNFSKVLASPSLRKLLAALKLTTAEVQGGGGFEGRARGYQAGCACQYGRPGYLYVNASPRQLQAYFHAQSRDTG